MIRSEVGWHPLSVITQDLLSTSKIPVGNRVFMAIFRAPSQSWVLD